MFKPTVLATKWQKETHLCLQSVYQGLHKFNWPVASRV